ncbi:hypothetical protein [Streptomyces sp. NPDC001108]
MYDAHEADQRAIPAIPGQRPAAPRENWNTARAAVPRQQPPAAE